MRSLKITNNMLIPIAPNSAYGVGSLVLFAGSFVIVLRLVRRLRLTWCIACDHAINLFLLTQGFSLPKGGAMDRV